MSEKTKKHSKSKKSQNQKARKKYSEKCQKKQESTKANEVERKAKRRRIVKTIDSPLQ
jgi:hypothetical protein